MNKELSLKSYVVFMKAAKSVQERSKRDIESYGINPTEFMVLEVLYHKGKQTIQQKGQKILMTSGSMTYVIDKLEKKGLIKRESCPDDRRATHVVITDKGISFMDEIFPKHENVIEQIFGVLVRKRKK
ncbi:hypothetical protein WQ57_23240 [Mesobacillus campisalis]|uniref:HTH marR-type domain-containing protein n=1 Tax=Mesobacillus campisalis TaxID=1408103 RepID=A0A0M2SP06_9BACI|nr:MarR family transcriptional regulator [Mesobacillus campisalis]KKK34340.1 hypothetical protein WQ57_23240 [Mesobacillus campisalis]